MAASEVPLGQADRARAALGVALVLYRWAALMWMVALAFSAHEGMSAPALAWAAAGVATAWSAFASVPTRSAPPFALWAELVLALAIVVISGVVVPDGEVGGQLPFFATGWPIAAVAAWGIARGPLGGVGAGVAISVALVVSRLVNGLTLAELDGAQWRSLINGCITYLLAGGAVGIVSRLLDRSAEEYHAVVEEAMHARERAARLAERESLARQIHDSVLQALALVHKRGRELAGFGTVPGEQVAELAEMAGTQEAELRALVLREPTEAPTGQAALRDALEQVARGVTGVPVRVTAVGPVWVPALCAREMSAAVKQALDNVVEHAGASSVTVFAEEEGGAVVVSVRDDGRGFDYDEGRLRAEGKAGLLRSVKGRVEDLGGSMTVSSSASGTEIELRVPLG